MAFDVSKFLALTVLIAGTGAACSSADDNDNDTNEGGSAGSSTSGNAGQGNDAAGADAGGSGATVGGAAAGGEGGGKTAAGGAGAGGDALGGADAGGAGGAPVVGECLGELSEGGAGGAGGIELDPSLEGLCSELYQLDCGDEDFAPAYYVCEGSRERAQPAVTVAITDCITALSAADQCEDTAVAACFHAVKGRGCANLDGAAACTAMKAREGCDAIDQVACEDIADLIKPEAFTAFTECMDPSIEGWYDETFAGTCVERLDRCAGLVL